MTIAEILLQDYDSEMKSTRTVLDRIPREQHYFKPHEKSMSCGHLSCHVANLPRLGKTILTTSGLDIAVTPLPELTFESREKLLSDFDTLAAETRSVLAQATDEHLSQNWTLTCGENTVVAGPRSQIYRTMFFNHLIHHRAQLGVYLRLNDVPVPALYGPSADDSLGL